MAKQGLVAVMLSGYTAAFSSYQGRCWDVLNKSDALFFFNIIHNVAIC